MKRLMILILLLLPLQYGKGQNLEQFFRTYHKEQDVDAIHIGNITMKLGPVYRNPWRQWHRGLGFRRGH